jgi:hypothetical protein
MGGNVPPMPNRRPEKLVRRSKEQREGEQGSQLESLPDSSTITDKLLGLPS